MPLCLAAKVGEVHFVLFPVESCGRLGASAQPFWRAPENVAASSLRRSSCGAPAERRAVCCDVGSG
jgi:hypothetical protein